MILKTLLSHYKRHPVQAVFLLSGIMIANVLLSGTLLINAQARASYNEGERLLQAGPVAQIQSRNQQQPLDERDYIRLRREGFDMLAPVLRRVVSSEDGTALELLGIDLLSMNARRGQYADTAADAAGNSSFTGFSFEPFQVWAAPARLQQLGWNDGYRARLESGQSLPPAAGIPGSQLGHRLLIDIGALQTLTGSSGELSWISVFPSEQERLETLRNALPDHLVLVDRADAPDPAELTRSFHLNLAAMGLLAFVVGVFLIYNALAFSYTDRQDLIRRMRLAGVSRTSLGRVLLLELALFLTVGCLAGFWLGAQLASVLLPGVGRTLAQLYDVYIAYPDSLAPGGFWLPLAMTLLAAALCVLFPLREALNTPLLQRWQGRWQQQAVARRDRRMLLAGIVFLILSTLLALQGETLWLVLAGMACLLLGAAMLLPLALRMMLAALNHLAPPHKPLLSWLVADSRWLLGPASLALMAMTLALVANTGLNTMIGSFRTATGHWLEQRLAADLFLRARQQPAEVQALLDRTYPGLIVSERYRASFNTPAPAGGSTRIEAVSLQAGDRYRDSVRVISGVDNAQGLFEDGQGIYISERAWRLDGWVPGASIALCKHAPEVHVLGVYHDYGNPLSQWLMSRDLFRTCWPGQAPVSLAVSGPADTPWDNVRQTLIDSLGLEESELINQAELKAVGMGVFDRTFIVTRALNALTLLVAGIGIFCAISAIHHHRVGQQALLASLGVNRRERAVMLLAQWGLLGLLCMVLVWPFGTLLAGYLAAVVTPVAFGWGFPLQVEWTHYLELALWACGSLLLAVVLPSMRLLRASPAVLLREQAL